ncbi:helix-turn-helix domain-containing protein [Halobacillus yeomjeoni]|uniref:Helix-turn-helix domain-containing protein n=1 Tax=Halobacillus yeomjeoni TaxID=311194 RepID=A0A931MUD1_9BACI|nr:helix-turn-helix domain-containing protein [Halobacillus yeomjeoni]MBH0229139.1 helix-turn-helix domain-containing protein [Halobacillus yeomjeoni]
MKPSEMKKHQTFETVEQLDLHVRSFLRNYKWELSAGNIEILKFIWCHSVKYPGVSFAKVSTIMNATGRSRSTIIRTINRLENLELIKRISTRKPNGKQGVNLLIIQPQKQLSIPTDDTLVDTADETPPKLEGFTSTRVSGAFLQQETMKKQRRKLQIHSMNVQQASSVDSSFLPSYIPDNFYTIAHPFMKLEEIVKAWKCVTQAYQKVNLYSELESYMDVVLDTFKQTVFAYKSGYIKKTFHGYFYGGLIEVFTRQVRREVMADPSNLYYDWLNESAEMHE